MTPTKSVNGHTQNHPNKNGPQDLQMMQRYTEDSTEHHLPQSSTLLPKSPQGNSWEDWDPIPRSKPRPDKSRSTFTQRREGVHNSRSTSHEHGSAMKKNPTLERRPTRADTNNHGSQMRNSSRQPKQRQSHQVDNSDNISQRRAHHAHNTITPSQTHDNNKDNDNTISPKQHNSDNARTTSVPPSSITSTVLFPVGSKVVHTIHGRGVILPPEDEMKVRVQFDANNDYGIYIDFPMSGSGIRRIYGET